MYVIIVVHSVDHNNYVPTQKSIILGPKWRNNTEIIYYIFKNAAKGNCGTLEKLTHFAIWIPDSDSR